VVPASAMHSGASVTPVYAGDRWEAWLVPVDRFPIPPEERAGVQNFVDRLVALVCLHEKPQLGWGIWPDRDPPTLWTAEEFRELAPGEMIRPLMHQVFRITEATARRTARNAMFGTGVALELLVREGDGELIQRTTQFLLLKIEEPSFRGFEFCVPLLDCKSLEGVAGDVLDNWLCGAQFYVRESPEDAGVLIISGFPLVSAWREMHLTQVQGGKSWMLPIP